MQGVTIVISSGSMLDVQHFSMVLPVMIEMFCIV